MTATLVDKWFKKIGFEIPRGTRELPQPAWAFWAAQVAGRGWFNRHAHG